MLLYIYLLTTLSTVLSRDVGKTLKTMPYVTNSLVNLGKMDISFHFNTHPQEMGSRSEIVNHGTSSFFSPKESPVDESCPCSGIKFLKDSSQSHPSELLNKILSGNDLFTYKESSLSPLCCDSHERIQEDILFEFGPKQNQIVANPQFPSSFPFLPYILNSFKNRPTLPTVSVKPKALEIFFFPRKRGISTTDFKKFTVKKNDSNKKDIIKIVGDKELRNDFKTLKFVPPIPSSVKKDLALQGKDKLFTKKIEDVAVTTAVDKHLNTISVI